MRCAEQDELVAFRDGELEEARAEEVKSHVAGCAACGTQLQKLERGLAALSALPPLPAPGAALRARVLASVGTAPSAWDRFKSWLRPAVLVPVSVGAAAMLLLLLPGLGAPVQPEELAAPAPPEAALVLDELEQLETAGLESPEDAEVVALLDELEAHP